MFALFVEIDISFGICLRIVEMFVFW